MSRARNRQTGLVGGEPARLVLDILSSFPLSVDGSGRMVVHNIATGEAAEMFQRAYEAAELDVLVKEAHCDHSASHATMDARDFEWMVLNEIAWRAKRALGEEFMIAVPWLMYLNGGLPKNARFRLPF